MGGGGFEWNILPSRWKCFECLSSTRTILQTDKTLQVNRDSKPPIIKVVQACVPVFTMWTWMSWRILTLPTIFVPLYIRRDNGPWQWKTPDSAVPLTAAVFLQAAGLMDSSTGRHSLYFQSVKWLTVFGPSWSVQETHTEHCLNLIEHLSLNLSSQTGKHSLFLCRKHFRNIAKFMEWIAGGDLNKHSELIEGKIRMYCQVYVYCFMDIWKCLQLF